jgi:hypothetical protein
VKGERRVKGRGRPPGRGGEQGARSDPKAQAAKFVEAAKALGCEENEEAFARLVRRIARHGPARGGGGSEG